MGKRQLAALFACSLIIWTCGNGLLPLLPVYAKQLGAGSALIKTQMVRFLPSQPASQPASQPVFTL